MYESYYVIKYEYAGYMPLCPFENLGENGPSMVQNGHAP
jgi:hypothetical protein